MDFVLKLLAVLFNFGIIFLIIRWIVRSSKKHMEKKKIPKPPKPLTERQKRYTPIFEEGVVAVIRALYLNGVDKFLPNVLCQFNAKNDCLEIKTVEDNPRIVKLDYDKIMLFRVVKDEQVKDEVRIIYGSGHTYKQLEVNELLYIRYQAENGIIQIVFDYNDSPYRKLYNDNALKQADFFAYVHSRIPKEENVIEL